jgi:FKBP-type peptidyl-prolyl cis-trans isomerase 2
VAVSPETGYGQYDKRLYKKISKERIPSDINPEIGIQLFLIEKK